MIGRHRFGQRGSGMVEAALCLLAFAMALFAIFEFSYLLFVQQTLNERGRAALRYGVVNPFDPVPIQNMVLYGRPDEPEGAEPALNLNRSMVEVQRLGPGTTDDRLRLVIRNYEQRCISPWLPARFIAKPITLSLPYEPPPLSR